MRKRIWELDAFRGLCVLGMVIVHFVYDLVELYRIVDWRYPDWFAFVKNWGGVLFILISGICATLGKRSVRRGVIVFLSGTICTVVTIGMYWLDMAGRGIIIYFGVLHCLGTCMILWPVFRKMPTPVLGAAGAVLVAIGLALHGKTPVEFPWLMPLGFMYPGFSSSDYFPLMPYLGFFLLGAVLGRTVYGKQQTLLPNVNEKNPVIRVLSLCGKHSLWIYLLHQPVLSGLCMVLTML